MRLLFIAIAALAASPATAQVSNPAPPIDTSQFASKADVQAAQTAASNAASLASSADTKATSAQTAAASTVKTVNGLTPTNGNVSITIPTMPDMSAYTTTSTVNSMISSATTGVVKSVNATMPNASGAVTLAIPTASTTTPPCIADTGTAGTTSTTLFNHTHCSKTRRIRATSATDGSYIWTYAVPFTTGTTPICSVTAETVSGVTDVINAQIEGTPTATAMNVRITRANRSVASLIGLTVLSIPSQPGATPFHAICIEP